MRFITLLLLISGYVSAQFGQPITIDGTIPGLRAVFLEDLNQDGFLDIIAFRTFNAYYFLNDGQGDFGPRNTLLNNINRPNHLQVGDIDGDGDIDLLLASGEIGDHGLLSWLRNDGGLQFTQIDIIPKNTLITKPYRCLLADLDGDSDLDAAVTAYDNDELYISYNSGNGTFTGGQSANVSLDEPLGLSSYDVDGDNVEEIFLTNYAPSLSQRMAYLNRQNNGSFTLTGAGLPGYANPNEVKFFDVDRDGTPEPITQFGFGKQIVRSLYNTSGVIDGYQVIWGDSGFDGGRLVSFHVDISQPTTQLYFYTASYNLYRVTETNGNFGEPEEIFSEAGSTFEVRLPLAAFGDVDQDGLMDIVYINDDDNSVRLRKASQSTLPVDLTDFSGVFDDGATQLQWSTSAETENQGYNLQRSTDGGNWDNISFVAANEDGTYTYTDWTAKGTGESTLLYRLEQIDLDGTSSYLSTITVDLPTSKRYLIFPNPASADITIHQSSNGTTQVTIFDARLLRISTFSFTGQYQLDTREYQAGQYFIQLTSGSEVEHHQVIIR